MSSRSIDFSEFEEASCETNSVGATTSVTSKSRGRKQTSEVWKHCRNPGPDEPERNIKNNRIFYCSYCPRDATWSNSNTSTIRAHLSSKHQVVLTPIQSSVKTKGQSLLEDIHSRAGVPFESKFEPDEERILKSVIHQKIAKEALTKFIISENLSFRVVENPFLFTLLKAHNPLADKGIFTSHSAAANQISLTFQSYRETVMKMLQSAISRIHLSLDIWTCPNKILLLGLCTHFVDYNSDLRRLLIGLPQVFNHRADGMLDELLPYLKEYGIVKEVGYIMSDNHSANDKFCRLFSTHLLDEEGLDWDATTHRLRCSGHIINLAVQAFLFQGPEVDEDDSDESDDDTVRNPRGKEGWRQRMGVLGKLHNIVIHIRGGASTGKYQEFKNLAGKQVPLDNDTRWNSWYRMINVALELESAIDAHAKKYWMDLKNDYLSPQDWAEIKEIKDFLRVFYRATLSNEGYKGLIDKVLVSMDAIARHYRDSQVLNS